MTFVRIMGAAAMVALTSAPPHPQPVRVSVQAVVLGPDGLPVSGLTQGDFQLVIDGQPRPIESFSVAASPTSVALLFDVSASFEFAFGPGNLLKAVDGWLVSRGPSEDRWRLGSFARRLSLSPRFTADREELGQAARAALAVVDTDRFGASPTWDAVDAGVTGVESEGGNRGVILVTDGRSTGNRRGMREVLLHAIAAGVPVSVVSNQAQQMFSLGGNTMLLVQPEIALRLMADETGGAFLPDLPAGAVAQAAPGSEGGRVVPQPMDLRKLGSLLDRVADEVRQSYLLGFSELAPDRQAHRLRIVVRGAGLTVRARKTYIAGPVTSAATTSPARDRRPRP